MAGRLRSKPAANCFTRRCTVGVASQAISSGRTVLAHSDNAGLAVRSPEPSIRSSTARKPLRANRSACATFVKPHYEHISLTPGNSWTLYVKRAEALPFLWHYHPEFELTLLENANGHRYVGDSLETFGSGDLVLIGPNQPHCWAAEQPLHADAPITAIVIWFDSAWWQHITTRWPEFASLKPLGEASARGVRFSAAAIARVRPLILSMEQQDSAVRLGTLFLVLAELARDTACQLLSTHGPRPPAASRKPGWSRYCTPSTQT